MAIIKGVEFSIVCNDEKLNEYNTLEQNDSTVLTYIEAQEETRYVLKYTFDENIMERLAYQVTIDGNAACWGSSTSPDMITTSGRWVDESTFEKQPFMFGKVITDSDPVQFEAHPEICNNVGTITATVWRAKRERVRRSGTHVPRTQKSVESPKIFEETTLKGKGIDFQTNYGTAEISKTKVSKKRTIYIDPHQQPFATFHFMYRSRNNLRSKGCIPMSLSPEPEDEDCVITGSAIVTDDKISALSASESKLFNKMQNLQSEVESLRKLLKDESQISSQNNSEGPSLKRRRVSTSSDRADIVKKRPEDTISVKEEYVMMSRR